jgi:hypothetical protein
MGSLSLYGIAIDEVRDVFGAGAAEAAALRAIAAQRFPARSNRAPGLLDRLGPLFRRPPDAPVVAPETPVAEDCERLLAGRHTPPHRLAASWRLLEAWVDAKAWGSYRATITARDVDALDFDLSRAGVPSEFSVRSLVARDPGLPLLPSPGLLAGYCRGGHALAAGEAWQPALGRLEPAHATVLAPVLAWLGDFRQWTDAAARASRPAPDLVGLWRA